MTILAQMLAGKSPDELQERAWILEQQIHATTQSEASETPALPDLDARSAGLGLRTAAVTADGIASRPEHPPSLGVKPLENRRSSIKVFPGGSVDSVGFKSDSPSAPPFKRPSLTIRDETVTTNVIRNDRTASALPFNPMNAYPKGRY